MDYIPLAAGVQQNILTRPVFATVATAAGTTTLTVTSASTQEATGSTTQTYTLPVVTTLVAGWATTFINKSTGNVTLNSSGGNSIVVLAGGQSVTLVCKSISADTTAAAWDVVGLSPRLWLAATKNTSQTLTHNAAAVATVFQTILGGTIQSSWNTTTGEFTAPITGLIRVSGFIHGTTAASGNQQSSNYQLEIKRSGTGILILTDCIAIYDANSTYQFLSQNPNGCVAVTAGDVLTFASYWWDYDSNTVTLIQDSQIQIEYLQ